MKKRVLIVSLIALLFLAAIFALKFYLVRQAQKMMSGMKPAPAAVTSAPAMAQSWRETLSAVGTVESFHGITVRSEIEGRIVNIAFESGARVKAGDVLVELETSTETAQLKSLEAAAKLAAASLARERDLRRTNTNTAVDLETAEATHAQALAAVEGIKATLAKKRIVAPFSGRLGIRQINIGQFLNKGDAIVGLETVDPAYVDFALPQQTLPLLDRGLSVNVSVDAYPNRIFEGKIEAIEPRVSDATRNVRIRAVVPNADEILYPGFFANVAVQLPQATPVLELPATAVVYSPYGNSVYVIVEKTAPDGTKQLVAEQRFVTTGAKRGDQVAILKGVSAGEQVVTAGQMKLRNGSPVIINNTVVPANSPTPQPTQS